MKKNGRKIVNVLLVEDNPVDARLAQEVLKHCRLYQCQTKLVDSLAAAKKHLGRNTTDAILLDLGLPDSAGLETYFKIREVAPRVPVVILSASGDQDSALAAIQDGAKDYLIKSAESYEYLDRAIRYAVETGRVERTIFEGTKKLREVSMAAIRMADISPDEDLYALITKSLRSLSGAMITHISVVGESSLLSIQHIDGLPEILEKAVSMLGVPIEGLEFDLDADIFAALRSGESHIATNLSETVIIPSLAPGIINKIQKLLGIGDILFLPLRYANTLIGICTAVFHKNTAPDKLLPQFMTVFTDAAAIAMHQRETQQRLTESEGKYRNVVERANDGIVIIQDGLVTYANAKAAEMKGESLEEIVGSPFTDNVNPEYISMIGDYYSALMAGDEIPQRLEIDFRSPKGQLLSIDINASLIEHRGQPAIMAMLRDITGRKMADEALRKENAAQRLLRIVAVAANEATDAEQALASVLKEVCVYAEWPIGHVYLPAKDSSGQLRPTTIWYLLQPERYKSFKRVTERTNFDPGVGLPGRVFSTGKPAWIVDVNKDTNFPRAKLANDIGVKAGFGFPVLVGTEVVAVLEFFSPEALKPDERLLEIMANVGTQLGRVFERQQATDKIEAVAFELRQLIETANAPIIGIDLGGLINEWNQSAEKITGFKKKDVMGKNLVETRITQDYQSAVQDVLDKALQGQATANYEFPLYTKDGERVMFLLNAGPRRDKEGNIVGVLGIGQDITELAKYRKSLESMVEKRTEALNLSLAQIETTRDRIDGILKAIGDGLIVTDMHNRVTAMNAAAEEMLRVRLSDVIDRPIDIAIDDKILGEQLVTTLELRSTGQTFDFELPDQVSEHLRIMRARTSVILDREGRQTGIITIIHDVSHEREVDRIKTEFISTAAHELRTPLTSILGFSEILMTREDLDQQEKGRFLMHINRQARALVDIINDLLDISRIESGLGFALNLAECDAGDAIKMVVEPFVSQAPKHTFKVSLPEKTQILIVDKDKLAQALENLIGNAVKYSPDGGQIIVSGVNRNNRYVVTVEDQGIGMKPEQVEQIFDKFYRADSSDTAIEGTGLGMSIVQVIINAHQGEVHVESEYGVGTKVTFSLPLPIEQPKI